MYKINTKMTGDKIKKQMRRADMETTDIAKMLGYARSEEHTSELQSRI